MNTYVAGRSGVSRSWRVHPCERSTETLAPPLVVASIAPYSAIETMMNAVTLPLPTDCVLYVVGRAEDEEEHRRHDRA